MTKLVTKYPESIAAGRALEVGVWPFALALAKEAKATGDSHSEITAALAEADVVNPETGKPYGVQWISRLVQVGTFTVSGRQEFTQYPVRRVAAAGSKHQWDSEAMLLTLKAGGTSHTIQGTSPLGKADRQTLIREADRLTAADRAAIATALVSEPEVKEAILRSTPMAREQHIILGGEIVKESATRSEERIKTANPSHAASDAADEVSIAATHLNNALAEVIQWNVTAGDDRLNRLESAMARVERCVTEINEALGRIPA